MPWECVNIKQVCYYIREFCGPEPRRKVLTRLHQEVRGLSGKTGVTGTPLSCQSYSVDGVSPCGLRHLASKRGSMSGDQASQRSRRRPQGLSHPASEVTQQPFHCPLLVEGVTSKLSFKRRGHTACLSMVGVSTHVKPYLKTTTVYKAF